MKSKNKKKKKQRKRKQNSWLRSRKPKSIILNTDPDRQKLAGTTTGEIFQPMRLHYEVSDFGELSRSLSKLNCINHDSPKNRLVWLYFAEAQSLNFPKHGIDENNPVILGEILNKGNNKVVLNVRTFERGLQAIEFFDKHVSRRIAKLTHTTICNKLFDIAEVSGIRSLDQYFELTETLVRNPDEISQKLTEIASEIDNQQERLNVVNEFLNNLSNEPIPELERFPVYFYDEGIAQLKMQLDTAKIVAYQHWKGNSDYTTMDAIHDVLSRNTR